MTSFEHRSFAQILGDIHAARAWYGSLGIPTKGTRVELIESAVQDLQRDLTSLPPEEVVDKWSNPETYYALSDAAGFGAIAREVGKVGPNLMPRLNLRRILSGPILLGDEVPHQGNTDARNIFVELELAAKISEKGLPLLGFDDLQFQFDQRRYHVQCKRLHSDSAASVQQNVDAAYRQLGKTMSTDHDRGFIVLAVEKVLGLVGKVWTSGPNDSLENEVHRLTDQFCERFRSSWEQFIDPRVIGIMLILRFLCYTPSSNVNGPAYFLSVIPLVSPDTLQASEVSRIQTLVARLA
jgi:hypothetical protein